MIGVRMNCDILCSYKKLNGAFTSLVDTYFNLIHYNYDIRFNIKVDNIHQFIREKKEYPYIKFYPNIAKKQYDIIIISADFIEQEKELFNSLSYKHCIILDSCKIYIDTIKNNNYTSNYINHMTDNVHILGNKFNKTFITNKNYYIWYHKLSQKRLQFLQELYIKPQKTILHRTNNNDNIYDIDTISNSFHSYKCIEYNRYRSWDGCVSYVENIGKLLFEFLYLGKKVFYSPVNKTMDDGLTEYLGLFGVDDNIEQELKISPEQIEDKLFMKEDDIIIQLINKLKNGDNKCYI